MRISNTFVILVSLILFGCDPKEKIITEIVIQEPPAPVSQPVSVNVEASIISGSFLVDEASASNSPYVRADYYLQDSGSGTLTFLGESNDLEFEVMVVNGSYPVLYQHIQGDSIAFNSEELLSQLFVVDGDAIQDINIDSVTVRANFTLNGSAFPSSPYDKGVFYLQPVNGGELIELGQSNKTSDAIRVLAGNYHVLWDYVQGPSVPINQMTRVMSDVEITANTGLDVNVETSATRVAFTLDGAAFPVSQYESAEFYLTNDHSAEAFLGKSFDAASVVNLINGIYDVEYRFVQGGETVPINTRAIVLQDYDASEPLALDLQTVSLSLSATLNGEAFAQSAYLDGVFELLDTQTGGYSYLGRTWDTIEAMRVIRGAYSIVYSQEDGTTVPQNKRAIVEQDVDANSDVALELDISGYLITGDLTLDGEAFPFNQYDAANILLRGDNTADDILLFSTYAQGEAVMVLPGTYDVVYSCQTCTNIPFNTDAVIIDDLEITGDTELSANLQSARIEVASTLNDGDFPVSPYADGVIWGGIGEADRVFMGRTTSSLADIVVLTGNYNFWYQVEDNSFDSVPINNWVQVDQQTIEN